MPAAPKAKCNDGEEEKEKEGEKDGVKKGKKTGAEKKEKEKSSGKSADRPHAAQLPNDLLWLNTFGLHFCGHFSVC